MDQRAGHDIVVGPVQHRPQPARPVDRRAGGRLSVLGKAHAPGGSAAYDDVVVAVQSALHDFSLYCRACGLLAGWAAGLAAGMWMLYTIPGAPGSGKLHFGGSAFSLSNLGLDTKMTIYAGFVGLIVNLAVAALGTLLFRAAKIADGDDATSRGDYFADEGDPKVKHLDLTGSH
ncbi:hypothetical protein [Nonomuraea africana]|uniref:hypothetical protein n=1 Tax=Nonomuraea africana TaxID=46171 RepID=UPI003404814F